MFRAESWAEAFTASAAALGAERGLSPADVSALAETSLEYLRVFCRAALALPGDLSGRNDADRLGAAISAALERSESAPEAAEHARRFIQLILRRGCFHRSRRIILAVEKRLDRTRGRVEAVVEAASEPDGALRSALEDRAKALTGAGEVKLRIRIRPELIGGLRLRLGSLLFDGSLKTKLRRMEADLGPIYGGRAGLEA
ncbi:MAG: F0F1 ATP synthase subunit delta [Treponema sp.]|nr:F0F1 ATP synthase subunit delta [Treponema sp.]